MIKEITDGFKAEIFKGREVFRFFKNMGDSQYDSAWAQNLLYFEGRVILPLNDIECLTSDTPIDRFSWDADEDVCQPLHRIILKSSKQDRE